MNQQLQQLFLLHVPKTAGTSIERMVADMIDVSNVATHIETLSEQERLSLDNKRFLSGHFHFDRWHRLPYAHKFRVAVALREPYSRLASAIRMLDRLNKPANAAWRLQFAPVVLETADRLASIDVTNGRALEKWLESNNDWSLEAFDNCEVRFLARDPDATDQSASEVVAPEMLALAIERLETAIDIICVTESLAKGMAKVAALLACSPPQTITRANGAVDIPGEPGRYIDPEGPEIRKAMSSWVKHDLLLYERACTLSSQLPQPRRLQA